MAFQENEHDFVARLHGHDHDHPCAVLGYFFDHKEVFIAFPRVFEVVEATTLYNRTLVGYSKLQRYRQQYGLKGPGRVFRTSDHHVRLVAWHRRGDELAVNEVLQWTPLRGNLHLEQTSWAMHHEAAIFAYFDQAPDWAETPGVSMMEDPREL